MGLISLRNGFFLNNYYKVNPIGQSGKNSGYCNGVLQILHTFGPYHRQNNGASFLYWGMSLEIIPKKA